MKAILCVVLAGCAAPRAGETLVESVRAYNDGVRWQRFEVAAKHVPPAERSSFLDEADQRAEDLKITDYDVVAVDRRGEREARVQIKVSWYRESEGTLRETRALQTWERHGKSWWMVDEAWVRGDEMPGLRETAGPRTSDLGSGGSP